MRESAKIVDMKLISPLLQIALGACLFVGGFVYDVMFVSVGCLVMIARRLNRGGTQRVEQ